MPWAPYALMAASAVMGAQGAQQQAANESRMLGFKAQIAENNAAIAEENAQYAIAAGQSAAEQQALRGRSAAGRIKAQQAASGIDINTGSAVDVRVGQAEAQKLDTETVMHNALLKAYGYRTQGADFLTQAELDRAQAGNVASEGRSRALTSLLGGASSIAGRYYQPGSTLGTTRAVPVASTSKTWSPDWGGIE